MNQSQEPGTDLTFRPSRDHENPYATYGPGPAQAGLERFLSNVFHRLV
jgi:hypothetical protein